MTSVLFSRAPWPPTLHVLDTRCNRVKLRIDPNLSCRFNVEEYEVQQRDPDMNQQATWTFIGKRHDLHRSITRLLPDTEYGLRVRAINRRGVSRWSDVVKIHTKLQPEDGGSAGPGYVWTQSSTEVCITVQVPSGTRGRQLVVDLRPQLLSVRVAPPGGPHSCGPGTILQGELSQPVRSMGEGSCWELVQEGSSTAVVLTLEKVTKSVAPKFDYWRSAFCGHPEIDTHALPGLESMNRPVSSSGSDSQFGAGLNLPGFSVLNHRNR
ncbi:hypothetical protein WJX72_003286 [[Myrmecia] bisecta]|uniref:Fibronectin type-III domain-containing protein n=1 Tax=[Myrmecia] bisecta TaxID=41462 RepID=A0AAW1Q0Q9_9CHLO